MRHSRRTFWITGMLPLVLAAGAARAQSAAPAASDPDGIETAADSVPEGRKNSGLFGKVKGLAGNKTVQAVAKTAACTMVPGGQAIAGAIDAASSKDVGAAAAAAGATAGQSCMPGMGGMGMNPGAAAAAEVMPGAAGGVDRVAGLGAAGLGAAGLAGLGGPGMPPAGAEYAAMGGAASPDQLAACLGLTPEEFLAYADPTGGQRRAPTKDEMKRQQQLAAKIDMQRYQACVMQQYAGGRSATGAIMVPSRADAPEEAMAGGRLSEAPGKGLALAADPAAELTKGKTEVKDIDWMTGTGDVSAEGRAAFTEGMSTLAAAIASASGTYRADIYLNKHYDDEALVPIGSARLETVLAALASAGLAPDVVTAGKAKKDKKPRLEIVRVKP